MRIFPTILVSVLALPLGMHSAFAQSGTGGAQPGTPAPGENPAVTKLARAQIDAIRSGKVDRTQYGQRMNAVLTDGRIAVWSKALAGGGAVKAFAYAGSIEQDGLRLEQYAITFEKAIYAPGRLPTGQLIEQISVDPQGKIIHLGVVPKY